MPRLVKAESSTRYKILVLAVAATGLTPLATAAAAGEQAAAVGIVGGTGARVVTLRLAKPPGEETFVQQGQLDLRIHNGDKTKRVAVTLTFYRGDPREDLALPVGRESGEGSGWSTKVSFADEPPSKVGPSTPSEPLVLEGGATESVRVAFDLPPGTAASHLNGTVVVDSVVGKGKTAARERLEVPVRAEAKAIADVAFVPKKVTVQVTSWCPFLCGDSDGGTVRLRGRGVDEALRDIEAAGGVLPSTQVRRGDGEDIDARLEDLHRTDDPRLATLKVGWTGTPEPGKYTASLPLSSYEKSAPELSVDLNSRRWFGVPFALITLGFLLTGWLLPRVTLHRRRTDIKRALCESVKDYCAAREAIGDSLGPDAESVDCDCSPDPSWRYHDPLDTTGRLFSALKWARNDSDLDEVEKAALALAARLRARQATLTDLRQLQELVAAKPPDRQGHPWDDTQTAIDTDGLLKEAKRASDDSTATRNLHDRIARQVEWDRAFAEAWRRFDELERAGHDMTPFKLDDLDASKPLAAERTPVQHNDLVYRVKRLTELMNAVPATAPAPPAPPPVDAAAGGEPVSADPVGALGEQAELLWQEVDRLQESAAETMLSAERSSLIALTPPSTGAAEPAPPEEAEEAAAASSVEVGGWFTSMSGPAGASSKKSRRKVRGWLRGIAGWLAGSRPVAWFQKRQWEDRLLSVLVLLATAFVYAVTVYSPDWGSFADWVSALAAGAAGQATVKLGVLPIFRSVRLRAKAAAAA
jgi:hypothetical protein